VWLRGHMIQDPVYVYMPFYGHTEQIWC